MNEKEKKAIELLKQPPDLPFIYCERENAIRIVLKLIKKQQKEIEDLKEDLSKKVKALDIAMSNLDYVCKDKIREKIKEYQKHIDNINNKAPKRKDGKPNNLFNHANREFYKSKVEVLEGLLEENNNE